MPFPAGGSFDVVARIIAQRAQLGQNVIVENRPGGGTVIGTEYVSRQPADGHTILSIGPSFTMHHAVRSKVPFGTEKDFRPVGQIMGLTMSIAVNPSLPAKTMKEYIALARAANTIGVGPHQPHAVLARHSNALLLQQAYGFTRLAKAPGTGRHGRGPFDKLRTGLAPVRQRRVRGLSRLRHPRPWVPAANLRHLRARHPGGVQLQAARHLSVVRHTARI